MGRTYKRELDDDYDDIDLDDFDEDDDFIDLTTRPQTSRRGTRPRDLPRTPSLSRSLPDDWQDFDYGGGRDTESSVWR